MRKAGFLLTNVMIFIWVVLEKGWKRESFFICLCAALLLKIGIADEKTFEIPFRYNFAIGSLGVVHLILNLSNWKEHVIGMCAVSGFLLLLFYFTKGEGIGGGDVKLMAAAGLLLGWRKILLAFFIGAVSGAVVHPVRMIWKGKGKMMALGPYLSLGIFISILYGEKILIWYFM